MKSIILIVLLSGIILNACNNMQNMNKTDVAQPEPVIFLELAGEAFEEYFKKNLVYPDQWYLLNFTFANGPYNINDPNVRASKEHKNKWRPKDCKYFYEILVANEDTFKIVAINTSGFVEYEILKDWGTPRKVSFVMGDDLCTIEQPSDKVIPEPARFLNDAVIKFSEYHKINYKYPKNWSDLDFHWALIPHKASDKNVQAPFDKVWMPLGGNYSYEIIQSDSLYYLIMSKNSRGLPNFKISSNDISPIEIP